MRRVRHIALASLPLTTSMPRVQDSDSDDDYDPNCTLFARRRTNKRGSLKCLTRKQRALIRKLFPRHSRETELAELFNVTYPTINRIIRNAYSVGRQDNLDSDSEYIRDDDVSEVLNQLRRLRARAQKPPALRLSTPPRQRREMSVSAPKPNTRSSEARKNEQSVAVPSGRKQIFQFLVNIQFSESQILAVLPRLRDAGITDDETFAQILTWPDCDIEQLLEELEEKKFLTTVQRIRIWRGILDHRD